MPDVIDLTNAAEADSDDAIVVVDGAGGDGDGVIDLVHGEVSTSAVPARARKRARASPADATLADDADDAELADAKRVLASVQPATAAAAPRSLTQIEADRTAVADALRKLLPCTVCMEPITDMAATPCGHVFCLACITASIKATKRCPNCAATVKLPTVHRIYW